TRGRWTGGATSPSPCRRSSSVRIATSRSCRTGSARHAAGTTAAWPSSPRRRERPARTTRSRFVSDTDRHGPAPTESGNRAGRGVRIAVDAMGGDHGAPEVVPGAIAYAHSHPEDTVILVGDEAIVRGLAHHPPANVRLVHAPELIGMDEHPARALVRKRNS